MFPGTSTYSYNDEDDLEKIKFPVVSHDTAASEEQFGYLREIFDGVREVKERGANGFCFWFSPWDEMIRWWGVQELMLDSTTAPVLCTKP